MRVQVLRKAQERVHSERSSGRTAREKLDEEEAALLARARGLINPSFTNAPSAPLPLFDPFIAPLIAAAKQDSARVWIAGALLSFEAVSRLSATLVEHELPGSDPLFAQGNCTPAETKVQVRCLFIGSDPKMKGVFDGVFSAWDEL